MTSVKPGVDLPADEQHVLIYLGLLIEQARGVIQAANVNGLRPSQHRVIALVPVDRGVTVTELAERVGMTKQGIGQFVTQLVESGHLEVDIDAEDRRIRVIRRTAKGTQAARTLAARLRDLENDWAESVGPHRYAEFRSLLEELAQS